MKKAIVLMNLGTPIAPTKKAVRDFLREFLSDRRVVEVPRIIWMIILYGIILTFRTPRVTKAYQSIWGDGASPLRLITRSQTAKLKDRLRYFYPNESIEVTYAMTYSGPSLKQRVEALEEQGIEHIMVLPLYPQYSATTTGSIYDQVSAINNSSRNIPQIHVIKHYFQQPSYIQALAQSVKKKWQDKGQADRLLMSFHSIPQKYSDDGDPYYHQCMTTAQSLAEELDLNEDDWAISFQSRLGFSKWLSPYTSEMVKQWGKEKVGRVDIICPAFSADCLETLEEIRVENREFFLEAGGKELNLIDCLNDQDSHIDMMVEIVDQYLPKIK